MDRTALHLEVRNALSVADELSRHEHYLGHDDLAGGLAALRSALGDLERDVGRSHADPTTPQPWIVEAVERSLESLLIHRHDVPRALRLRTEELIASAERVSVALWEPDARVPSKPVLGMLPLARVIPQDVHSALDYVHTAGFLASAALARTSRARAVGLALGAGLGGGSLVTDYRLSAAKVLPIETHEKADYAIGLAAVLAPFLLGYARKDPVAAMIHVGLGVGSLVTSLLTDYRATKGLSWPMRSRGGPPLGPPHGERGIRVPDAQRPLEGLSSAPTDWELDPHASNEDELSH
jgi:hypothetical protein